MSKSSQPKNKQDQERRGQDLFVHKPDSYKNNDRVSKHDSISGAHAHKNSPVKITRPHMQTIPHANRNETIDASKYVNNSISLNESPPKKNGHSYTINVDPTSNDY